MAASSGRGSEHLFLGEPQWESLPGGRVRCVQTGHEMPLAAQLTYATTKKCRSALFEAALKKRAPPLNFFDQSPVAKDKIICKMTRVVLNKKEDAVWKHMLGKKFEQKLGGYFSISSCTVNRQVHRRVRRIRCEQWKVGEVDRMEEVSALEKNLKPSLANAEKEAEKEMARKDVEMTEISSESQSSKVAEEIVNFSGDGERAGRKKKEKSSTASRDGDEQAPEDAHSDDSDFWVPPAGARWDFDLGSNDRWCLPSHDARELSTSVKINGNSKAAALEDCSEFDNGDTEMLDGENTLALPEESWNPVDLSSQAFFVSH